MIKYHGGSLAPWLLTSWGGAKNGITSMRGMQRAARLSGLTSNPNFMNIGQLKTINEPVILFIKREDGMYDYSVCYGFDGDRFVIGETSWGLMQYWPEEVEMMWVKGITLTLYPNCLFVTEDRRKSMIDRHINCYMKSEKVCLWTSLIGILLFSFCGLSGLFWLQSVYGRLILLVMAGILYYFFSVAYLKWKVDTTFRLKRLFLKKVRASASHLSECLDDLLNIYPSVCIQIMITTVLFIILIGYLIYVVSFLSLVSFLYLPFSAILIFEYGRRWNSRQLPFYKDSIGDSTECREIKNLRIRCMILFNAGVAGVLCGQTIWIGLLVFVVSWGITNCLFKIRELKDLVMQLRYVLSEK